MKIKINWLSFGLVETGNGSSSIFILTTLRVQEFKTTTESTALYYENKNKYKLNNKCKKEGYLVLKEEKIVEKHIIVS